MEEARARAYAMPLADFDMSDPELYLTDTLWPYFERLRKEEPVHYCGDSEFGPYWSVTKFQDIKAVDSNHRVFSSEGTIVLQDPDEEFPLPMFIAMDPPKHDKQRKTVASSVAPRNLAALEGTIRSRVVGILDSLPVGETFNWVDLVSIELTTQMLATLFDFPFAERRKLTRWSDVATANPESGLVESEEQRRAELLECLDCFMKLWHERKGQAPGHDLISMMAHGDATQDMPSQEYLGNLILLIVGGNDTTRNSISGGVLALNQHPAEYQKLRDDPTHIPNMVSEIIRWQTPLAYMRRTATQDVVLGGKRIKAGDKLAMWYVSGNRDEEAFVDADAFIINRPNARSHLSFGYGIHRCMGNRLGEMQLRILWEEILKRFHNVEVVGEPVRTRSSFVKGYRELPVRVHRV